LREKKNVIGRKRFSEQPGEDLYTTTTKGGSPYAPLSDGTISSFVKRRTLYFLSINEKVIKFWKGNVLLNFINQKGSPVPR